MNKLQFKISAALKNIIGRDLITDDFIAVFELVKNSYDAYASEVKITFDNDKIIISDNGKGMSLDDLRERWLFIAYSAKKEETEDNNIKDDADYRDKIQAKRYFAGAKGIGRFSCDRLGNELILTTRKHKTNKVERLYVKWDDFNKSEDELINISVLHETLPIKDFPDLVKGTILEIKSLNSSWKRKKIQDLKHSLEKLINPFESSEQFKIQIICEHEKKNDEIEIIEIDKVNGFVNNFIFEKLEVKTTQIKTHITRNKIITELIDRGEIIYKIQETNKKYNYLDDVSFNIFFLNRSAKNNFKRLMGIDNVNFGSVFLFKNNFRVYPYGNDGDDSYGLEKRKGQGYARYLGPRDLLGRIELTTNLNEQFKEVSSRDGGLVETEGLKQLVDSFYDYGIKRIEKYVVGIQWAYKLDARLEGDKDRDDLLLLDNAKHKARIIELITKLTDNKNVELLNFNKNFLDIIDDKIQDITPDAFKNLKKIAKKVHDNDYVKDIQAAEKRYLKLLKEKEEAEKKAEEERLRREEAEKKRIEAELKAKAEEEKRLKEEALRKAEELKRKEAELKKREAEIKRKEAEQKAKEEKEKRKDADEKLGIEKQKNLYFITKENKDNPERDKFIHSIKLSSQKINSNLINLISDFKEGTINKDSALVSLTNIHRNTMKVLELSRIVTHANFSGKDEIHSINLVRFIEEYVNSNNSIKNRRLNFSFNTQIEKFLIKVNVLDLSILFENLISNSEKAKAKNIQIDIKEDKNTLIVNFSDDGDGLIQKYKNNVNEIFKPGVTSTEGGSGIGLPTVKDILKEMNNSKINFVANGNTLKGATFKIQFNK